MAVLDRWMRPLRVAAWRAGLVADRTRAAAHAVERILDSTGAALVAASRVPGLAVVVRFAEGRTIRRAFGTAGEGRPMRSDTVVQALSLSKPVTAVVAMALVERGVLDLDEPVWRRARSWTMPPHRASASEAGAITLRRVLSHTSGLNVLGHARARPGDDLRPSALLAREDADEHTVRVVRPAGTFGYSGGGFIVAQLLMEDATGRRFADLAREIVFAPLGMRSSEFELSPALAPRLATAHDAGGTPVPFAPFAATAASGLLSTADDVVALWSAFVEGPAGEPPGRGIVSPRACEQMLAAHVTDGDGAWGLGFRLKRRRGDLRYVHAGYDLGWHHFAEGLRRRRVVFALLSNGDRGRDCVPRLSRAMRLALYDLAL